MFLKSKKIVNIFYNYIEDAKRVLSKGELNLGNCRLKIKQVENHSIKSIDENSECVTLSPELCGDNRFDGKVTTNIDPFKILLKNAPLDISRDHLELYIDSLSGEIEIKSIELSKVDSRIAIVSFYDQIGE